MMCSAAHLLLPDHGTKAEESSEPFEVALAADPLRRFELDPVDFPASAY
jgi:hypothetical protein